MTVKEQDEQQVARTELDPDTARARLKEGLVEPDTGIYLRVEDGPRKGRVFTLSPGGVYLIGREGADIELDGGKISRKHAELGLYGPEALVLRDLASTNGTFVNGNRVTEKVQLKHWDLIQIGDSQLRFAVVEAALPLST